MAELTLSYEVSKTSRRSARRQVCKKLFCCNSLVKDALAGLSPLKGMPLKELRCDFDKDRDALILDGIATLEKINDIPVASFWTKVGPPV